MSTSPLCCAIIGMDRAVAKVNVVSILFIMVISLASQSFGDGLDYVYYLNNVVTDAETDVLSSERHPVNA